MIYSLFVYQRGKQDEDSDNLSKVEFLFMEEDGANKMEKKAF